MNEILSQKSTKSNVTSSGVADSLDWFDLRPIDTEQAARLAPISDDVAEEIIEEFYDHILRFDAAAQQFASDDQIRRVKAGQKKYFKELISASLDDAYVEERRRIGRIHEAAGITPTLYIGSYAFYMSRLGQLIGEKMADDPGTAFTLFLSLLKIAHFDMALALETYVEAREATIEMQQQEMSELPTPVLQLKSGLLLVPVVGSLNASRARKLTVALLESIHKYRARAVVLDITGVSVIDSAVANHLIQAVQAARLMGALSVLTGVSSEVAQSMVRIGVTHSELYTAGDLQSGIVEAEAMLAR